MAHRFKEYPGVKDPDVKKLIAKLEFVDNSDELVHALEQINASLLSPLTDDGEEKT